MSASQRVNDAWNSRDPARVVEVFAENGVRHQFAHEEVHLEGRAAISEMVSAIMHSVPDCSLEIRGVVDANESEVIEWIFRGTLQNDFGPIPANGQAVDLNGCSVLSVGGDGLILEERVYWDGLHFLVGAGMLE